MAAQEAENTAYGSHILFGTSLHKDVPMSPEQIVFSKGFHDS